MKDYSFLFLLILLFSITGCLTPQQEIDSEIVGTWYAYDIYKLDNDDDTDDLLFHFFKDGTYHNKFYDDIENESAVILETRGTYSVSSETECRYRRTHKIEDAAWVISEEEGIMTFHVKGDELELSTGPFTWDLTRK